MRERLCEGFCFCFCNCANSGSPTVEMVAEKGRHLFEVEVQRSPPMRETQKKVLVGLMVCVLGLTAAVTLADGRGISIHGARSSVAHRTVLSATRHFQSLDEEAKPAEGEEKKKEEEKKPAEKADAEDDEDSLKPEAEKKGKKGKIVLVGDDELNVAMQRYYEEHPSAFQWSLVQQIIGGAIALIAAGVLVYSEVNAMLLQRDLDALKAAELLAAPKSIELAQRELWWGNGLKAQWRVLLTGSGLGICFVAVFVAFTSECPMLAKLEEKYDLSHTHSNGNCLILAFLLAILNSTGLCALLAGVTWMCTRPLPGILLILISISADWYNTSDEYMPVLTWIACAAAVCGAYYYFALGDQKEEEEETLLNKGPREFV